MGIGTALTLITIVFALILLAVATLAVILAIKYSWVFIVGLLFKMVDNSCSSNKKKKKSTKKTKRD